MKKILITDDVHPVFIETLQKNGFLIDYQPEIDLPSVINIIGNYVGLVINSKILVDKKLLDAASHLEFVCRLGSGLEIIDLKYAAQRGVAIINSPEGNRNAVAEHALGMLLALANQLHTADAEVRQKIWLREARRGFELKGKTIGIIGFGHTGSSFAKKMQGLEMNVLAFDKYKKHYTADFPFVHESDLPTIQARADIISLHLPLTAETTHLVDAAFLQKCKQGVLIINTSRGAVVETNALINALENGSVGGACLDVFENEKTATFSTAEEALYARLYKLPNVILTPHIAGWTQESKYLLSKVLLEKMQALGFLQA